MTKVRRTRRVYVEVTAYWGNDDAESSIKLSRRRWNAILNGDEYTKSTWSWYEGKRSPVTWSFLNGSVSLDGEDGMQCVLERPACDLIVRVVGEAA
jgi:hypothetical protein